MALLHDLDAPLSHIQARLAEGIAPTQIIDELVPHSRAEAVAYARRRPLWDEYRGIFPPQVVAIARVLSRRAMRQFGLILDHDGHVAFAPPHRGSKAPVCPRHRFLLWVGDEELRVEYAPHYFPNSDQELFTFVSPHEPPRSHPLSETGYWSHFTPLRKPASARPSTPPEGAVTNQSADARPTSGPHSARVLAEETGHAESPAAQDKPRQGFLF